MYTIGNLSLISGLLVCFNLTALAADRLELPLALKVSAGNDMTHPNNFRFPEPLRIHPTMPYMVFAPSFLGDWEIRPGSIHESRYRFVVHDGELPAERIEALWRDYAEPLVATAG